METTFRNGHHDRDDGDDDHHDIEHQRHAGGKPNVDIVGPSHRDIGEWGRGPAYGSSPAKIAAEIATPKAAPSDEAIL